MVWLFRWRETDPDGKRQPKKIVVGPVSELRTEADARRALQALRINVNLDLSEQARPPRKFADLVDHYRLKELGLQHSDRKSYSTKMAYKSYPANWIVPQWGEYMLARMENGIAVHVEEWLSTISRSRGTKAKIRNIMSAVCSHAVRYGWMTTNPIRTSTYFVTRFRRCSQNNDEDVKTVQSLMRHANSNITMNIYTHAVSSKKRRAQQKVVEMILPEGKNAVATKGVA